MTTSTTPPTTPTTGDAPEPSRDPSRGTGLRRALAGVVAAGAGLASGELVAAFSSRWPSPVIAVGDRVVDAVPRPVKDLAIALFDTADKAALLVGILLVLAVLAALVGRWTATRRGPALAVTGLLGLAGVAAALADPIAPLDAIVPGIAAGAAAVAALAFLTAPGVVTRGTDDLGDGDAGRRSFLARTGGVAVVAAVAAAGGRALLVAGSRAAEQARSTLGLPTPSNRVELPPGVQVDADGAVPFITPNDDFYRIDTQLTVPRLSADGWTLTITGMVREPLTLTLDELLERYEVVELPITLTCVSNEVGGDLAGTARWLGVRLADVLEDVGVQDGADQLVGRAFDGFTTGFPVANAFDRDALLVVGMNGEPLPARNGFPLRMVVPGLYGYVSATKWLTEIELTTFDAFDQYWVERGWDQQAPIKVASRIDTPGSLATVARGTVAVAGVAWAQTRGIERVEVRVDEGDWVDAELAADGGVDLWRQWLFRWDTSDLEAGRHDLEVRATDAAGTTQPEERQPPFPNGATGWHRMVVRVAEA